MRKIRVGELLLHALMLSLYAFTYKNAAFVPGSSDTYGGEAKFFTKWNLYLNIGYFAFSCVVGLISFCFAAELYSIRKFQTLVFCSTVVPSNLITAFVFWGIYALDPELMLPAWIRKYIPINGFQNHAVHTAPIFTVLMEWALVCHQPPRRSLVMLTWVLYALAYLLWIVWIAYHTDIWVYPFLQAMANPGRAMFFGGTFVLGCILSTLGLSVLRCVGKNEESSEKLKKKKNKKV